MRVFNLACQEVLDYGYEAKDYNKTHLNRGTYKTIRKKYPTLPSALVQTARDQASDMLKRDKFKYKIFKKEMSSIRYDSRTMKVFLESGHVSLSTLFGRLTYNFQLPDYYKQYATWEIKNAQLLVKGNDCYLHVQVEADNPEPILNDNRLGIDMGINNIAVCSDNSFYNSKHHKAVKSRYQHLKAELQSKGTRSAKRKLKKISGRERRFVMDMNHCLSKELVKKPHGVIAMENLTNIKKQNKGRKFNHKLGNWSFHQLQTFIEYKAENVGKIVLYVKPQYTSQTCSRCGHKDKNNRKDRLFKCKGCGFELDADLNAARNIATFSRSGCSRVSVNHPNVAPSVVVTSLWAIDK
jgi:IS605 OrfB family transposase